MPRIDRRKVAKHSRDPLPLGAVRIRRKRRGSGRGDVRVRVVKVRTGGPKSRQWKSLARHWWEANRGPVPRGYRVCHLDGDTLNDDPSNYGLLRAGDVLFLAGERDPAMLAANHEACRAVTAALNRERARVRRMTGWLESRWYPVDPVERRVYNAPFRMRWQVYRWAGLDAGPSNWRSCRADGLGWPGLRPFVACALAALADAGDVGGGQLRRAVEDLRRRQGWEPAAMPRHQLHQCVCELRRRGYASARWVGGWKVYRITQAALDARRPPVWVVPMRCDRACELVAAGGYARVEPAGAAAAEP